MLIPNEFSQTQAWMNKPYTSKDKKKIWYSDTPTQQEGLHGGIFHHLILLNSVVSILSLYEAYPPKFT